MPSRHIPRAPGDRPAPAAEQARSASIVALAEALVARQQPAAGRLLASAIGIRALAGPPGGTLTPTTPVDAALLPPPLRPWVARGLLPFRCKPLPGPAAWRSATRRLIEAAAAVPELNCPPHWVVGDRVLTLQLPDATDLRRVLAARGAAGREWVYQACLRCLAAFADRDAALRSMLAAGGRRRPAIFPVAQRYALAHGKLARLLGPLDLAGSLPTLSRPGPLTLFCDPKPANFVLPRAMAAGRPAAGWPLRIDLDLLRYACPVSLQVVLALFSHPIRLPEHGPGGVGFAGLLHDARAAGRCFGIEPAEIERMIRYHLLRNFTAAADGASAGDRAKALALAPILQLALTELPSLPSAPHTAAQLASWRSAQTDSADADIPDAGIPDAEIPHAGVDHG
jgi:hypothetical protein